MYVSEKRRDGVAVCLYVFVLYATLPIAPTIFYRLNSLTSGFFGLYLTGLLLAFGLGLCGYVALVNRERRWGPYLWLVGIAGGFGLCLTPVELASERVHFLEYGLLSWFLLRALRHHFSGTTCLLVAACAVTLLGVVDEGIQWVLPNRYFEWRDVGMNTAGGMLGLLLARFVLRPAAARGTMVFR